MSKLILVTGGARSGKSSFAEKCTDDFALRRVYIATAHVCDEEMAARVARHKQLRAGRGWTTIEEETDLELALVKAEHQQAKAVLVDCLTVWINNLLYVNAAFREDDMAAKTRKLLDRIRLFPGLTVLVLNEVGQGIVPDNALARTFRDCSGRCGQMIAKEADEVWYCVCGIPLKIKG